MGGLGGVANNIQGFAGTLGQWISGVFGGALVVYFSIRWFMYTHASDDQDIKHAKRRLWTTAIGAIGFFTITAVITTIKSNIVK